MLGKQKRRLRKNMKQPELKRKAADWLESESKKHKTRPQKFTPKEVADSVGGYAGTLGNVASEVVEELAARGIKARYVRQGTKCFFELL